MHKYIEILCFTFLFYFNITEILGTKQVTPHFLQLGMHEILWFCQTFSPHFKEWLFIIVTLINIENNLHHGKIEGNSDSFISDMIMLLFILRTADRCQKSGDEVGWSISVTFTCWTIVFIHFLTLMCLRMLPNLHISISIHY